MNGNRANKLLGIALGEKSLLVAEVHGNGDLRVVKSAEFCYPEGVGLEKPTELGKQLAAFLKAKGIVTHTAVIGLPAKWILTRKKDLPPTTEQAAAGMLRLAAESEFAADVKDLAIDYVGEPQPKAASTALMVATSGQRITQCRELAKAGHLRLEAVTITGTSLARVDVSQQRRSVILCLAPVGNELVVHQQGVPMQLRHLALTNGQTNDAGAVVAELRRAMAGLPGDEVPGLMICANPEMGRAIETAAGGRLGTTPRLAQSGDQYSPAAAVAIAAMRSGGVDFLHSRLTPAEVQKNRRPLYWGVALAATAFFAAAGAWYDLHAMDSQVNALRAHLKTIDPDVQTAQVAQDRLQTAKSWMAGKPRYLACVADLTSLFPDEGSTYATTLTLRSDLSGQVSGRAASEQQALNLLDKILKDTKRFKNVTLGEVRDAGRNSREIAFSISFTYQPE